MLQNIYGTELVNLHRGQYANFNELFEIHIQIIV